MKAQKIKQLYKVTSEVIGIKSTYNPYTGITKKEPSQNLIMVLDLDTETLVRRVVVHQEEYLKEYVPIVDNFLGGKEIAGYEDSVYQLFASNVLNWITNFQGNAAPGS